MTASFGPQNANASLELPPGTTRRRYGAAQTWVKDESAPGAGDGSVLDAAFYNNLIGNLEYLLGQSGTAATPGDMTALYRAVLNAVSRGAPDALDTLRELSAALNDDANFGANVLLALGNRIRFDAAQTISDAQREQLRQNIRFAVAAVSGNYADLNNTPTLGTAASKDVGNGANQIPQLDATGKMPAVDGSQLTNVNATGGLSYTAAQSLSPAQKNLVMRNAGVAPLRNFKSGMTLATVTSFPARIQINAGQVADSTNSDLISLTSALVKTPNTWSVGTGAGGLDTGSSAAINTWYKIFTIKRLDTGVVDAAWTTNALAAGPTFGGNIPSAYTEFRYLGSVLTDGSGNITTFIQDGSQFMWTTPGSFNVSNPGTAAVLRAIKTPLGVRVRSRVAAALVTASNGDGVSFYLSDPSLDDVISGSTSAFSAETYMANSTGAIGAQFEVYTNTSQQIRTRVQTSVNAGLSFTILTLGWHENFDA